jgi:hypothetical protein
MDSKPLTNLDENDEKNDERQLSNHYKSLKND